MKKILKIQLLKDVSGQNYIGVNFNTNTEDANGGSLNPFIKFFLDEIPDAGAMHNKLLERNHNKLHATLFNVMECKQTESVWQCVGEDVTDIKFIGVGSISKDNKVTYYIVIESDKLNALRQQYGYANKHFHITIGYNVSDLFHAAKDKNTLIA